MNRDSCWLLILLFVSPYVYAYETQLNWKVESGVAPSPISSTSKVNISADSTGITLSVTVIDGTPNAANAIHDATRIFNDDRIALSVRPSLAADRYYQFTVSSAGATADFQGSSTGNSNANWTEHWDGNAVAVRNGYSVNIKVPWKTLGVSSTGEFSGQIMVMQFDVDSTKTGRDREFRVSNIPIDYRHACFECQFEKFTHQFNESVVDGKLQNINNKFNFYPYVLISREYGLNQAKIGLDVERKDSESSAWLTVNPDYSSVESDPYISDINQINVISRSENRHFFQSAAPLLSTPLNLLYTRSIIDPIIGIQYKRESDGNAMAIIATDDSTLTYTVYDGDASYENTILEDSYNFIGRFSKVFESGSAWSLFSSFRSASAYKNSTLSLDGVYFPNKNNKLIGQIALSSNSADEDVYAGTKSAEGEAIFLGHNYAGTKYATNTSVRYISDDFQASLGQVGRPGVSFYHNFRITNKDTLLNIFTESGFRFIVNFDASNDLFLRSYGDSYSAYVLAGKYRASISFDRNLNREIFDNDKPSYVSTFGLSRRSGICQNFINAASGRSLDYRNETLGNIRKINYGVSCSGSTVPWYFSINLSQVKFASDFESAGYKTNIFSMALDRSWKGKHILEGSFDIVQSNNYLNPLALTTYKGIVGSLRYIFAPDRKGQLIVGANFDNSKINSFESDRDILYIKYRMEY